MEHHRKSGFTVRDILLIPDVQEAVLLAGAKGIGSSDFPRKCHGSA